MLCDYHAASRSTMSTMTLHFCNTSLHLALSDTILSFSFPIPGRLPFTPSAKFKLIVRPKQILSLSVSLLQLYI
jgi:hypothetical protein